MLLRCLVLFEISCLADSLNVYEPARSPAWNYFGYSWVESPPSVVFRRPMSAMVDLTNDLGVAILQDYAYSRSNFAFSPYGVASVLVVLYEGARSESARQIHRAVKFPWDRDITRIGFRDIHRHLRTYFSHEGYLSGITLSKEGSTLKPEYKRILRFYGYDVDVDPQEKGVDLPSSVSTEKIPPTSSSSTSSTSDVNATTIMKGYEIATTTEAATERGKTVSSADEADITSTADREQFTTVTIGGNEESFQSFWTSTVDISDGPTTENPVALTTESIQYSDTEPTAAENTTFQNAEDEMPRSTTEIIPTETESVLHTTTAKSDLSVMETTTETDLFSPAEEETTTAKDFTTLPGEEETTTAKDFVTLPGEEETTTAKDFTTLPGEEETTTAKDFVTLPGEGETTTAKDFTTLPAEEATTLRSLSDSEELSSIKELRAFNSLFLDGHNQGRKESELDNGMLIPQALAYHNYLYYGTKSENIVNTSNKINSMESMEKIEENHVTNKAQIRENPEDTLAAGGARAKTLVEFLPKLKTAVDNGGWSIRNRRLVSVQEPCHQMKYNCRSRYPRICPFNNARNESDFPNENGVNGSGKVARRLDMNPRSRATPMDFQTSAVVDSRRREWTRSRKEKRTLSDFLKIPVVPDLSLQLQNGMFDSHVSKDYDLYRALPRFLFLVDGAIDTPVPMMTYTNIFPFAYIPRLHCKALEFPLDDERYKLLIILPVERRGLRQLIYDLAAYPLRDVINVLRPARVKAVVPTFMVEGFVILTPTLQKLGIWDVFDPRKSDLSGMTTDPDLYVRNIEQSVTVVIRNYVEILDIQTRTMAARDVSDDFIASHPFLYFVMDTTTNVALMAGQMLDPLNSRIY